MGISIRLVISSHVSQERWRAVYNETLRLAKKLHLADIEEKEIHGHVVNCLVPCKEIEQYGKKGWQTVADYIRGDHAESFFFPEELYKPKSSKADNEAKNEADNKHTSKPSDILLYLANSIDLIELENSIDDCQEIWGDKTQGRTYHLSLLAIGCLVQDRLGDDAIVVGDINAGQCREAVQKINKFLKTPIQIPCQCEPDRWLERIARIPADNIVRLKIAFGLYDGAKNSAFGEKLREVIPHEILLQYWREEFTSYSMRTVGYYEALKNYLTMGFDIGELCELVPLQDSEGKDLLEDFVKTIMNSKLHWKEKDCSDWLVQDPDDPTVYGIEASFIRFFNITARNRKVDRYIPIDELRKTLHDKLGERVDCIIDTYLQQEEQSENADTPAKKVDHSAEFNQMMNDYHHEIIEKIEQYEVYDNRSLEFYKPGDRIAPEVKKGIKAVLDFADEILKKDDYKEITSASLETQEDWLTYAGNHLYTMRDRDWKRIFHNVETLPNAFRRYFPLFCIDLNNNQDVRYIVMALIINDDLYNFAMEVRKEYRKKTAKKNFFKKMRKR